MVSVIILLLLYFELLGLPIDVKQEILKLLDILYKFDPRDERNAPDKHTHKNTVYMSAGERRYLGY
jgi:hypothetical protein